jgi:hypothetical protein
MKYKDHVGGILNITGVRPGNAFAYDGPTMPGMVYYTATIITTHDAIDMLVMPPPLKADRSQPAELTISYFVNRHNRAFDGRVTPYQAVLFTARTVVHGKAGVAGWEYVDGLYGDKTEMDIMGPWSVYFGMLKKMADIRFLPLGGDKFEITVVRRGVRLVTMQLRMGAPFPETAVQAMNQRTDSAAFGTFTVREIPDSRYTGFVDRGIYWAGSEDSSIDRAWAADEASIEFGSLDQDPWTEMPVLSVSRALIFELTVPKEVFHNLQLVEQLDKNTVEEPGRPHARVTPPDFGVLV